MYINILPIHWCLICLGKEKKRRIILEIHFIPSTKQIFYHGPKRSEVTTISLLPCAIKFVFISLLSKLLSAKRTLLRGGRKFTGLHLSRKGGRLAHKHVQNGSISSEALSKFETVDNNWVSSCRWFDLAIRKFGATNLLFLLSRTAQLDRRPFVFSPPLSPACPKPWGT